MMFLSEAAVAPKLMGIIKNFKYSLTELSAQIEPEMGIRGSASLFYQKQKAEPVIVPGIPIPLALAG